MDESKDKRRIRTLVLRRLVSSLIDKLINLEEDKVSFEKQAELMKLLDAVRNKLVALGV